MTAPRPFNPLRPTEPLPNKPAGYAGLATYSSLSRLWTYLEAAARAGREISVVRGDTEKTCRRRIAGHILEGAGLLLDEARLLAELEDGLEPHPALIALLGGDNGPLRELLNKHYVLRVNFVLAFTRGRDLIVRPEFKFVPKTGEKAQLPTDLPLTPRRMGRDELRFLLERACGL